MAGYVWNSRRGATSVHRRAAQGPSQIACRICDHVFMSTQALIDHIELHLADEEFVSARRYGLKLMASSERDPFANRYKFNLVSPTRLAETRPLSLSGYRYPSLQERNPISRPAPPPPPPPPPPHHHMVPHRRPIPQPQAPYLGRNNNNSHSLSVPQRHHRVMHQPFIPQCTKPFLQQLDKPFSHGAVLGKRCRSDSDTLDLSLKL